MKYEIKPEAVPPKLEPGTAFLCPNSGGLYVVVALDSNMSVERKGIFALRVKDNTVCWWSSGQRDADAENEEILGNDITLVVE
jgi:hypothetical protein